MSVYVSKRGEIQVQFLETARKLSAHTSQIYTNIAISPLDHYIKDKLRVKFYGIYVDDFYFFVPTFFSWKGHMKRGNSYIVLNRMDSFVESLMG